MQSKISVIVPVYNVEKYIHQAIKSVVNQSYSCLEIILIDDGSTDDSGKICDDYAKLDSRIIVLHQSNAGAAAAKNAGLRVATGEYLAFLDSDDYLEPYAYQYMIKEIERTDADVIQCSFRNVYVNEQENMIILSEKQEFSSTEYLVRFTEDWTCGLLWDKLYKRSLFENIYFEEGHKIDDEFFTYQGIINARKIIHDPKIVYNYRKRKSSVMLSPESKQCIVMDKIDYLTKRRKNVVNIYPELESVFNKHYYNMLIILLKDTGSSLDSINLILSIIKKEYLKIVRQRNCCDLLPSICGFMFRTSSKQLIRISINNDKKNDSVDTHQYFV